MRNPAVMPPSADDLYRAYLPPYASALLLDADHRPTPSRHESLSRHSTLSSLALTLSNTGDSPPNHNLQNPALGFKSQSHFRQTHIRARAAASPYPRDTESVHSSSSETEDIAMYLGPTATDYNTMYASPQMLGGSPDMNAAGAFGRMNLSADHALETGGPYAVVRHPSYGGALAFVVGTYMCVRDRASLLAALGVWDTPWGTALRFGGVVLAVLASFAFVDRARVEDEALKHKFGRQWEMWARRTPYKLIPFIF